MSSSVAVRETVSVRRRPSCNPTFPFARTTAKTDPESPPLMKARTHVTTRLSGTPKCHPQTVQFAQCGRYRARRSHRCEIGKPSLCCFRTDHRREVGDGGSFERNNMSARPLDSRHADAERKRWRMRHRECLAAAGAVVQIPPPRPSADCMTAGTAPNATPNTISASLGFCRREWLSAADCSQPSQHGSVVLRASDVEGFGEAAIKPRLNRDTSTITPCGPILVVQDR